MTELFETPPGRLAEPWRSSGRRRRLAHRLAALRAAAAAGTDGARGSTARVDRLVSGTVIGEISDTVVSSTWGARVEGAYAKSWPRRQARSGPGRAGGGRRERQEPTSAYRPTGHAR